MQADTCRQAHNNACTQSLYRSRRSIFCSIVVAAVDRHLCTLLRTQTLCTDSDNLAETSARSFPLLYSAAAYYTPVSQLMGKTSDADAPCRRPGQNSANVKVKVSANALFWNPFRGGGEGRGEGDLRMSAGGDVYVCYRVLLSPLAHLLRLFGVWLRSGEPYFQRLPHLANHTFLLLTTPTL